ncbi:MAG: RNA-binding domain-containing protein [Candidatus Bathyarchaeia archaeon]
MSQTHVAYIDVRFSVHATEDPDKVIKAVRQVLPADYADDVVFKKKTLRGHYRNPITLFETRIKKKEIVKALLTNVFSNLKEPDRESLLEEIDLHMEKGSLYVRLDKQAAFQGEMKLCTADPIRVRIRFRKKRIEDIVKICQELGMSP